MITFPDTPRAEINPYMRMAYMYVPARYRYRGVVKLLVIMKSVRH